MARTIKQKETLEEQPQNNVVQPEPAVEEQTQAVETETPAPELTRTEQMQQQLQQGKAKDAKSSSVKESSSSSSAVSHSGLPKGATDRAAEIADAMANNGSVAQALAALARPNNNAPQDPEDEIKRENKKKDVLLLQQMLQTIMSGVAANNNSNVPMVDNTAEVNTVNNRIQRLKDTYANQLALRAREEQQRQNKMYELARERDRQRNEIFGKTLQAMRESNSNRNSESESNSVSLGWVDPNSGKATTRGGARSAKPADVRYLRLGNQDFRVDKNTMSAIDDQVARVLYTESRENPEFREEFERTTKQDIVGMNQESFSNFLKTNAGHAYLLSQLSKNDNPNITDAVFRVMKTMDYLPEGIDTAEQLTDWYGGNPYVNYQRPAKTVVMEGANAVPIYEANGRTYKGEDNIVKTGKGNTARKASGAKKQQKSKNPNANKVEGDTIDFTDENGETAIATIERMDDGKLYAVYDGTAYPYYPEQGIVDYDDPYNIKKVEPQPQTTNGGGVDFMDF